MSERGRSTSPRPLRDAEMAVDSDKPNAKVVIVTNLTRNVVKAHLQVIFGVYGDVAKIDLPVYGKSGQNRGKAAVEYAESQAARKAASHMNGGQLDGAVLKAHATAVADSGRLRAHEPARARGLPHPGTDAEGMTEATVAGAWDGDCPRQGTTVLVLPVAQGHVRSRLSVAGTPAWDHAEDHQATLGVDTVEDVRGPAATPCAQVALAQDLPPVRARALVLGHAPCLIHLIRETAGAEVALDLGEARAGGVTAEMISETADQGPLRLRGTDAYILRVTVSDEHLSVILSMVPTDATNMRISPRSVLCDYASIYYIKIS
ncbi:hypothetical protein EYR36_006102 [Pleurotus pulmonarius]|nr:hypothetical protein EYR36_006102 [Pleurotus pulmonarius]